MALIDEIQTIRNDLKILMPKVEKIYELLTADKAPAEEKKVEEAPKKGKK